MDLYDMKKKPHTTESSHHITRDSQATVSRATIFNFILQGFLGNDLKLKGVSTEPSDLHCDRDSEPKR